MITTYQGWTINVYRCHATLYAATCTRTINGVIQMVNAEGIRETQALTRAQKRIREVDFTPVPSLPPIEIE